MKKNNGKRKDEKVPLDPLDDREDEDVGKKTINLRQLQKSKLGEFAVAG